MAQTKRAKRSATRHATLEPSQASEPRPQEGAARARGRRLLAHLGPQEEEKRATAMKRSGSGPPTTTTATTTGAQPPRGMATAPRRAARRAPVGRLQRTLACHGLAQLELLVRGRRRACPIHSRGPFEHRAPCAPCPATGPSRRTLSADLGATNGRGTLTGAARGLARRCVAPRLSRLTLLRAGGMQPKTAPCRRLSGADGIQLRCQVRLAPCCGLRGAVASTTPVAQLLATEPRVQHVAMVLARGVVSGWRTGMVNRLRAEGKRLDARARARRRV